LTGRVIQRIDKDHWDFPPEFSHLECSPGSGHSKCAPNFSVVT
jgi:hypothetical protein